MKTKLENEPRYDVAPKLLQCAEIVLLLSIAVYAFPEWIRRIIGRRDGWKCQEQDCDKRFQDGYNVDIAHYNHDKNSPEYNDPNNGRVLCLDHHEIEHRKGARGLTRSQNDWAADKIASRARVRR